MMTMVASTSFLVVVLLVTSIYAEDPAPAAESAAPVAVPAEPTPAATPPAEGASAAPAAASTPEAAPVAPPSWPDTVQIDKAGDILIGKDEKLKRILYFQAQGIIDQVAQVVTSLDELSKKSFDEFVKSKKSTEEFLIKTESSLGKLKKSSTP